jgi:DNA topoisomerase I
MPKNLVIVESPAKARTIGSFLGKDYEVVASYGHVRDLPEKSDEIPEEVRKEKWARFGVNLDAGYEPIYVVPSDKRRRVSELKAAAKDAERLLLATDEDREGESISWHVLQLLSPKKGTEVQRIVFHEVTPEAIREALANPRQIDEGLVRAQETRRILDRLYGYTLSPLLWRIVAKGLSAGRVQSVAVRLVVLRERERREFVIAEYAGVKALLKVEDGEFEAELARIGPAKVADGSSFDSKGKCKAGDVWLRADAAGALAPRLEAARPWTVTSVETKPGIENPPQPFMTSTLQQEASRKLGFTARRTMQVAQQLYEGIDLGGGVREGLITYMRTDSLTLADRALQQARQVVTDLYGADHLPPQPRRYKSKAKNAQEAHEAIRPTDLSRRPADVRKSLDEDQFKLYDLIWKRTLACQMKQAEVERTRVEVDVTEGETVHTFTASGKRIVFAGFLRVYVEGKDDPEAELGDRERILPALAKGQQATPLTVEATEHATRPPARYTEASLVEKLEQAGVGRPSTYASIIGTIQDRGYVFKKGKELVPTWTAFAVTEILEQNFERLVDLGFTAQMEEELDEISNGKRDWRKHLDAFYKGTAQRPWLVAEIEARSRQIPFPAIPVHDEVVVRIGRNGPFLQRGEGGPGNTASVPEDLPPADLTPEVIERLLASRSAEPDRVATDPATGAPIVLKSGRFGPYLELVPEEGATKRVTVPPGFDPASASEADIVSLLQFPRSLGNHPETGAEVVVAVGRYGAYLTAGESKANVGDWRTGLTITLDEAVQALAAKGAGRQRGKAEAILEFGSIEGAAGPVRVLDGRYGPYVTDGETNATIPKGTDPKTLTAAAALDLLQKKKAAGPSKRPFKGRRRR